MVTESQHFSSQKITEVQYHIHILSGFKHRLGSVMHMSFWIAQELNIYPRGWGNLKKQSPLAQVLLKKKSPWYPPHKTGIHLIEGGILSLGIKFYSSLLGLEKLSNISIQQKSIKWKNTLRQITKIRERLTIFFRELLTMTCNYLPHEPLYILSRPT